MTTLSGFDVAAPTGPPTLAVGTASGSLDTSAVYGYKLTYVTGFGETQGNTTAATETTTSTGSMNLTAIPLSPNGNVTQRKLYRTVGGGAVYLLLATISDNTTTTYTDIIADGSLGVAIPTLNNAGSRQIVNGELALAKPLIHSIESAITAFATGGQTNAYQLSAEYSIIGTVGTIADSVKLPELATNLIGTRIIVANDGANSANIFPFLGQNAGAGTDTAVALAAAARAEFVAKSATVWVQVV